MMKNSLLKKQTKPKKLGAGVAEQPQEQQLEIPEEEVWLLGNESSTNLFHMKMSYFPLTVPNDNTIKNAI